MIAKNTAFLVTILLLQSCDCFVSVKGKIISNSTKQPIQGAIIEMVDKSESTKSDAEGYFSLSKQVGLCFGPQIKITKKNYKPFEMNLSGSNESKSYKVKSKQDFVDYDAPFFPDPNDKGTFTIGTWIEKYSQMFSVRSDTILFYLDTVNVESEILQIKSRFRHPK